MRHPITGFHTPTQTSARNVRPAPPPPWEKTPDVSIRSPKRQVNLFILGLWIRLCCQIYLLEAADLWPTELTGCLHHIREPLTAWKLRYKTSSERNVAYPHHPCRALLAVAPLTTAPHRRLKPILVSILPTRHVIGRQSSSHSGRYSGRVVRAYPTPTTPVHPGTGQVGGCRTLVRERRAHTRAHLEGMLYRALWSSSMARIVYTVYSHMCVQCSVIASLLAGLVACVFAISASSSSSHLFSFRTPTSSLMPLLASTPTLPPAFVLGCMMTAASGALRLACYKTLGSLFTFELTLRSDHRLVTSGPYAFVRHPSYSGVVLGVLGTLLVHFGPGSWWAEAGWLGTLAGRVYAICWCGMEAYVLSSIMARAPTEDALLKKQFGAEWDEWAARVPYRVIPGVF